MGVHLVRMTRRNRPVVHEWIRAEADRITREGARAQVRMNPMTMEQVLLRTMEHFGLSTAVATREVFSAIRKPIRTRKQTSLYQQGRGFRDVPWWAQ